MLMTSPIVERLLEHKDTVPLSALGLMREAASLLESQEATIARLSAELARARAERDRAALVAADEANRADAAERQIAELRTQLNLAVAKQEFWRIADRNSVERAEAAEADKARLSEALQTAKKWFANPDPNSAGIIEICIDAALSGSGAGGWRLVPIEPTEDMILAAEIAEEEASVTDLNSGGPGRGLYADDIYRAMLAAAPTPPAGGGDA